MLRKGKALLQGDQGTGRVLVTCPVPKSPPAYLRSFLGLQFQDMAPPSPPPRDPFPEMKCVSGRERGGCGDGVRSAS